MSRLQWQGLDSRELNKQFGCKLTLTTARHIAGTWITYRHGRWRRYGPIVLPRGDVT